MVEARTFGGQLLKPVQWSDEERKVLINNRAVIYLLQRETIRDQRGAGRPFWYVTDGYEIGGRNRLLDFPSRLIEVAIFPNPEKFFVPGSFGKPKTQQEDLLAEDLHKLRRRLGLEGIDQILPEASEATEVAFKHFDATRRKVRLFGKGYGFRYVRTNTPTNPDASRFADVGYWGDVNGIHVFGWRADCGYPHLGAARWVVPAGNR